MFILNTFKPVRETFDISYSPNLLQQLPCGLHRANLNDAYHLLPELGELYSSVPIVVLINRFDWEIDVKIHMLMKDQYPCIPNWHCDNVPRDDMGQLEYHRVESSPDPKMYLWVSDDPLTEFLTHDLIMKEPPDSHADIAQLISLADPQLMSIPKKTWVSFDQNTPHREVKATRNGWRIFVRLTHKSILPARPVISTIRRHCQVYLNANEFSW